MAKSKVKNLNQKEIEELARAFLSVKNINEFYPRFMHFRRD